MNKFFVPLLLGSMFVFMNNASAVEKPELLIKFKEDIFTEVIRSHGPQIESKTVLNWCQFNELADEVGLTVNELKRVVYDSFIVAGTKNVQATEIARKMSDSDWDLYNSALFSDITRYKNGIQQGLNFAHPTPESKTKFCLQFEQKALKAARTLTH